ncbi:Bdr family repetitive protein [Borrelia miyamotoi]|uniref:Bdr family repetitive protein n=1 Tax=Borrelia miyamotoi TaxID=47466 RepID=UPI0029391577|nr:Bdr family repetitive protein [Borrelia miyamotoi]
MGLPQSVITRQMVLAELIKAGINQEIAEDLSYRYYKNELTHKDIEYLKENFDIKLEKVEVGLKADIKASHSDLDNKIDTKFTELDNKIDKVETSLKSDIASVSNEVALVRKDMEINKMELNSQLVKITSKLESSFKLHYWMFGTVITLFVGIFLTLIFK